MQKKGDVVEGTTFQEVLSLDLECEESVSRDEVGEEEIRSYSFVSYFRVWSSSKTHWESIKYFKKSYIMGSETVWRVGKGYKAGSWEAS